jgi:thiosulfate/3-mercaptopyruvate sulfurtransferase
MSAPAFVRLTAAEADRLLRSGELHVFDSRDESSFAHSHIDGATRLYGGNLEALILGTPREQPVLIYCYHGISSQQYATLFADYGFTRIHDLIGGFEAWQRHTRQRSEGSGT